MSSDILNTTPPTDNPLPKSFWSFSSVAQSQMLKRFFASLLKVILVNCFIEMTGERQGSKWC